MRDKQFILNEIRRTAAQNGGKPVGVQRFKTETGIAQHEWCGIHWARWSEALMEAGFEPLEWNQAIDEEQMIAEIALLVRKFKRFPIKAEILIEKKKNVRFVFDLQEAALFEIRVNYAPSSAQVLIKPVFDEIVKCFPRCRSKGGVLVKVWIPGNLAQT